MRKRIYLSGPIEGIPREEACLWRKEVIDRLDRIYDIVDPTRLEFSGTNAEAIVRQDIIDIVSCDIVIVYIPKITIGTMQELGIARLLNKDIYILSNAEEILSHPWISTLTSFVCLDSLSSFLRRSNEGVVCWKSWWEYGSRTTHELDLEESSMVIFRGEECNNSKKKDPRYAKEQSRSLHR